MRLEGSIVATASIEPHIRIYKDFIGKAAEAIE
jgi:hypothetical protein